MHQRHSLCDVLHHAVGTASIEFCGEKIHPKTSVRNLGVIVQATHQQRGQQLLSTAEADEELTKTAAIQHSKDGGQQLRHQQD